MKEIIREKVVKEVVCYEANDGTQWATKESCEAHEKSYKGIIYDRVKKLKIGSCSQEELFGYGYDDCGWDIVLPKSVEDINDITAAIRMYNPTYRPIDYKYIGKELMLGICWEDGLYYRFTTLEDILSNINKAYKNIKDAYHKEV